MTRSTLYRKGHLCSPADPTATALLVRDGTIDWLGPDTEVPCADDVVDLAGALVTPAFVDAHVHCTGTGLALDGLDLAPACSTDQVLAAVADFAAGLPADAVLLGHGWEESRWPKRRPPTAQELDRASGGRKVYLSQASIHSAAVSAALLAATPDVAAARGFDPSGWLRGDAHQTVRKAAFRSVTPTQRTRAQRAALRHAASLGIAAVHECGGPEVSDETDFTGLLALARSEPLPEVYGYWGELMAAGKARELGACGAGGDLCADGALGARTAHLSQAYEDDGGYGHGYLTAEQVRDHLLDCAANGMQGGFHAIGNAAIGTVLAGLSGAAARLGEERVRAARHRIEHAVIADKRLIAGFVEHGVVASMQPAFDRLWGGEGQLYARRLGAARSLRSNPIGALHGVGVALAFGSDSPVTPLDPWGAVRAAMWHHNPAYRMSQRAAFAAHTRGGWRAVHRDTEGVLVPGAPATFAVWSVPAMPALDVDDELPLCQRTVLRGTTIYCRDTDLS